jgi:hypothetical protein
LGCLCGSSSFLSLAEINKPIHQTHHHDPTDDIPNGHWKKVHKEEVAPGKVRKISRCFLDGFKKRRCTHLLDEHGNGDEVHVGDAVLKTRSNKGCDGWNDRKDFVYCAASTKAHPNSHANQRVAKYPEHQGLGKHQAGLCLADVQGCQTNGATTKCILASQEHQVGSQHCPNKIAQVDHSPISEQGTQGDPAVGEGDNNQVVTSEQLRAGNNYQNQA